MVQIRSELTANNKVKFQGFLTIYNKHRLVLVSIWSLRDGVKRET